MKKLLFLTLIFILSFHVFATESANEKKPEQSWMVGKKVKQEGQQYQNYRFEPVDRKARDRAPAHQNDSKTNYRHFEHWDMGMGM